MNRKSAFEERIEKICNLNRFSTYVVLQKTKKIVEQYREAMNMKTYYTVSEEETIKRFKKAVREKYEMTYIKKEGEKTGSIDYMLMEVMATDWAQKLLQKVLDKMENFDEYGDIYVEILKQYFISESKTDDVDIQVSLDLGRAYYYRMKKSAITLFGILLWNIAVEACLEDTI